MPVRFPRRPPQAAPLRPEAQDRRRRLGHAARKAKIAEDLAALPVDGNPESDAGTVLAGFLADIGSAWVMATPDERNRLARQLFGKVVIANRTAVAVVPRPDLRPFFELIGPEEKSRNAASVSPEAASGQGDRTVKADTEPAEVTGFEPAISALTGLHVRPLHHTSRSSVPDGITDLKPMSSHWARSIHVRTTGRRGRRRGGGTRALGGVGQACPGAPRRARRRGVRARRGRPRRTPGARAGRSRWGARPDR